MNILIHGAVNNSNFGDCLYAQIYNEYIKSIHPEGNVFFWENRLFGAGEHLKTLSNIATTKDLDKIDALVYMPGGYFGEGPTKFRRFKQYVRYFRLGNRMIAKNKTILVSAIGGERVESRWLLNKIAHILKHASLITTRNERTAEFFQPYTSTEIVPLFDVILHVRNMPLPALPAQTQETLDACAAKGKKKIFFHIQSKDETNVEIETKILPALNRYLAENDAHVFVGTDYLSRRDVHELKVYQGLQGSKSVYDYSSPLELCAMLKQCDLIVTTKLHVGVVSSALGKSVVSVALVPTKTRAFYEDIGCGDRCFALTDVTPDTVYEQIVKFADQPIEIPTELVEKSARNLDLLKDFIERLNTASGR